MSSQWKFNDNSRNSGGNSNHNGSYWRVKKNPPYSGNNNSWNSNDGYNNDNSTSSHYNGPDFRVYRRKGPNNSNAMISTSGYTHHSTPDEDHMDHHVHHNQGYRQWNGGNRSNGKNQNNSKSNGNNNNSNSSNSYWNSNDVNLHTSWRRTDGKSKESSPGPLDYQSDASMGEHVPHSSFVSASEGPTRPYDPDGDHPMTSSDSKRGRGKSNNSNHKGWSKGTHSTHSHSKGRSSKGRDSRETTNSQEGEDFIGKPFSRGSGQSSESTTASSTDQSLPYGHIQTKNGDIQGTHLEGLSIGKDLCFFAYQVLTWELEKKNFEDQDKGSKSRENSWGRNSNSWYNNSSSRENSKSPSKRNNQNVQTVAPWNYNSKPVLPPQYRDLNMPLFVTWSKEGILRGCIGCLEPLQFEPGLRDYVLRSSLHDSRFPPITLPEFKELCNGSYPHGGNHYVPTNSYSQNNSRNSNENSPSKSIPWQNFNKNNHWEDLPSLPLTGSGSESNPEDTATGEDEPGLSCQVSVLHSFEDISWNCQDWDLGTHGLLLKFEDSRGRRYSGTYLPEVPLEAGFTKQSTIVELCKKAGFNGIARHEEESFDLHKSTNLISNLNITRYQSTRVKMSADEYCNILHASNAANSLSRGKSSS